MISPKDSIQLEVHFAADAIRAGFTRFVDERSADLKAMVGKFCDDLAKETSLEVVEAKIRERVVAEWRVQLERFIQGEAYSRVYDEMEKLRRKLNTPARKRARREAVA